MATGIARFARRTFDSISQGQARMVLETRPDPVASVRRSGPRPYRILCFGGGALRGMGIRDHNLGLPGRIADRLVEQTGRGVQIDVVVPASTTSPAALAILGGLRLRRYDAVVVVLGDCATAATQPDQWRGALVGLTHTLLSQTCASVSVFVWDSSRACVAVGLTGGTSREAAATARLAGVTEDVCRLNARVRHGELRPTYGALEAAGRFSDDTYRDWADSIVTRLKLAFAVVDAAPEEESPNAYRNRPQDERFRQRALDSLRLRTSVRDEVLDREVGAARAMYRSAHAALTIIDGDQQWSKASTRADLATVPRSAGACGFAIESDELTLINDTQLDPRTKDRPLAQGPGAIRFYAGFPVHSIDGYRIGMVCIYGDTPRAMRPRELEGLRDAAARVEQHLWNSLLRGGTEIVAQ